MTGYIASTWELDVHEHCPFRVQVQGLNTESHSQASCQDCRLFIVLDAQHEADLHSHLFCYTATIKYTEVGQGLER